MVNIRALEDLRKALDELDLAFTNSARIAQEGGILHATTDIATLHAHVVLAIGHLDDIESSLDSSQRPLLDVEVIEGMIKYADLGPQS